MPVKTWKELAAKAIIACDQKDQEYIDRLKFELIEIDKQGANNYWIRLYNSNKKFEHNKNGLVFPYLLGITNIDPINSKIEHVIKFDPEFPDIDVDLLPEARDPIKRYAEQKYGQDYVCNVGLWLTYKAKLALQDAATALGYNRHQVISVCKKLPDEFDEMSYEEAYNEFDDFRKLANEKPDVVELGYKMMGKIKSQGKHAGGFIISSVPVKEYVPLTYIGRDNNKQWTTAWTEGMAATQLSKFGFIKFDLLGLLNISYIYNCKKLIKKNRGVTIDFDDMDPRNDRVGWEILEDGTRNSISFNDPESLIQADKVRLDSIFQFDTNFAQSIVEKGGVKSFTDLLIYTSLGRPGPLPMIDVYIKNRDDPKERWKDRLHPKMLPILEETKGVLTFQEQLLSIWVDICGFTMPEAAMAQKMVKKKQGEYLNKTIGPRVIEGAAPILGNQEAQDLWDTMVSFGRYCFNRSHAVAYMIIAYRCLWLKTHYPSEWWAAVLSECSNDKAIQFMGSARSEKINFGSIDINNLSVGFAVSGDTVTPGVLSIKGIGDSLAKKLVQESNKGEFSDLDDFVGRVGKAKIATERLIKLGGFEYVHKNRKALWMWFQYEYDNTKESRKIKQLIKHCYAWSKQDIYKERDRQADEYRILYPRRSKIPSKILKWVPTRPNSTFKPYDPDIELTDEDILLSKKLELTFDHIVKLFPNDYSLCHILEFEKEYLGYYWHSPLDMFEHKKNTTIEHAKSRGILECVIEEATIKPGARGDYMILMVTDGISSARVNVWGNELLCNDSDLFEEGSGIRAKVQWQDKWRSFAVCRNTIIMPLSLRSE